MANIKDMMKLKKWVINPQLLPLNFFQHIVYCNSTTLVRANSLKKQQNERGQNLHSEIMSNFDQIDKIEKFKGVVA